MNGCISTLTLSLALLTTSVSVADEQQPATSPAQTVATRSAKELIGIAIKKSRTAKSDRDFAEMAYYLDKSLKSEALLPSHRKYAEKLKGWAHNRLGESFAARDKDAAALKHFELAVKLNPQHWKALHNRGVSYAIDQRFEEAQKDFASTIRLNPKYATAWYNRAEVLMRIGKFEAAIDNYSQAIELNPDDAYFYISRGKAFRQQQQFDSALADFDRALQLGKLAEALVERGDVLYEQGDLEQAADDYRAAIRLDDQFAAVYRSIAWMMATSTDIRYRDVQRAVKLAEKAIRLHGDDDYRYFDVLAAALANADQFETALEKQQLAIKLAVRKATGRELQALQDRLQQYQKNLPHRQERVASRPDNPRPVQ